MSPLRDAVPPLLSEQSTRVLLTVSRPGFRPGQIVMTPGVADLERQGKLFTAIYLRRLLNGDWGDLSDLDRRANDAALKNGDRLLSAYQVTPTLKLWIITEWDHSVTTLLLPDEY